MSVMPFVERLPLAMGPLALAVRDGTLPAGSTAEIPRTLKAWREHIEICREPMMGLGWATTLRASMLWQQELRDMPRPTANATTWLLSTGWKRLGLLRLDEAPA